MSVLILLVITPAALYYFLSKRKPTIKLELTLEQLVNPKHRSNKVYTPEGEVISSQQEALFSFEANPEGFDASGGSKAPFFEDDTRRLWINEAYIYLLVEEALKKQGPQAIIVIEVPDAPIINYNPSSHKTYLRKKTND